MLLEGGRRVWVGEDRLLSGGTATAAASASALEPRALTEPDVISAALPSEDWGNNWHGLEEYTSDVRERSGSTYFFWLGAAFAGLLLLLILVTPPAQSHVRLGLFWVALLYAVVFRIHFLWKVFFHDLPDWAWGWLLATLLLPGADLVFLLLKGRGGPSWILGLVGLGLCCFSVNGVDRAAWTSVEQVDSRVM